MKKNILTRSILISFFTVGMLISLFQNCSNVRLSKLDQIQLAQVKTDGSFCTLPSIEDDIFAKVIFIVDMSGSNVFDISGSFKTDIAGERFNVVRNFLSSTCARSNPNNKFTVLGFSNSTMGVSTCKKEELGPISQTNLQIQRLVDIQNGDVARGFGNTSNVMKSTVYESGINCARDIVREDIASLTPTELLKTSYHVMFLSDGEPTTTAATPVADPPTVVYDAVKNLMSSGQNAAGINFQPILYGIEELKRGSISKYNLARRYLAEMAKLGQTVEVEVNQIGTIDPCELYTAGKRTPYKATDFGVINLTAKMVSGRLEADSDMDGKPDRIEQENGFDPTKNRSGVNGNGLIDGFCNLHASRCIVPSTPCTDSNLFGFTQCEIMEYQLSDGIDSDRDGLPDLVEFLKGTQLTSSSDTTNDLDGDGMTGFLEILKGRDPNFWDNGINADLTLDYRRDQLENLAGCPMHQDAWKISVSRIPIVDTLETKNTDPVSRVRPFLNHRAGENVILVYYILKKANGTPTSVSEMYGQFIKVSKNQAVVFGEFKKLGDINGTFTAKP